MTTQYAVYRAGMPIMADTPTGLSQGSIGGTSLVNSAGTNVAYAPGQIVVFGNSVRIVHKEVGASNVQPGAYAVGHGTYDVAKVPSVAITDGADLFWDSTNLYVTPTPTGIFFGVAIAAALAADTTVRALHLPNQSMNQVDACAVAASTAITNTVTETAFSNGSFVLPANTLAVGDVIRVRGMGIATATHSTDTLEVKLKIGSTVIVTTGALDVADNNVFEFEADLIVRTIGATGTFVARCDSSIGTAGTATRKIALKTSTTIDTTAAQTITVTGTWSVADTGNSCQLEVFTVEALAI